MAIETSKCNKLGKDRGAIKEIVALVSVRMVLRYTAVVSLLGILGHMYYNQGMATRAVESAFHSLAYVTVPNITIAKEIAREIVSGKLAACVNIIPAITSIYEWQGKIEEEPELLLIIKTKTSALEALKQKVLEKHPYEVPEFITSPISSGSETYLKWIEKQVQ